MNLYDVLHRQFGRQPQRIALQLPDGRHLTQGELDRQSAQFAHWLVAAGVRPGDRVAVQVEKSVAALLLYLACLRAGAIFLPLNPAYRRAELEYFLADARPRLFICAPPQLPLGRELAGQLGVAAAHPLGTDGDDALVTAARALPTEFASVARKDRDPAALLYTSGTTGRSKGAVLSHGNLAVNAEALCRHWGFQPDDVLLHMLPIFHVHGLFVALHCALLSAASLLFEPKFDAARAVALLPRATVFMGVPTYYARLLQEAGLNRQGARGMRLFISGSAPLLAETFAEFERRCGHRILERYGMSEGGMFTSNPLRGERRPGTVGRPLPGVAVRVADAADQPLPAGRIGEVQVRGENVFAGYWQMPEKTRDAFAADGFFRTGDLGRFSADGYLTLIGRSSDLIISGGLNVYPKEIEEIIDALPGVAESAVIGLPDADYGEAVTAVVVRRAGCDEPAAAQVIAAVRAQLAGFKVPKAVRFAAALPRNAMGKVQKSVLRETLGRAEAP